ncbi:MAG: transglutaminase-like cysteine peptidase [Sphingopyxis sp.]|uniref:transglutaminase-like cysteine peptidase n=1 Tax=Sphingopyxis sp. TaxID=1908224 RepID=UPI001A37D9B5|nr:transglutaminase-like cysteine peptidase [Sphingopyxis sp.]MBL9066781.1 transglutaminase-like cysteine peptidase [Sphingopyxis sp.]
MPRAMFARLDPSTIASVAALSLAAMAPATAHAATGATAMKMANAKSFAIGDSCQAAVAPPSTTSTFAAVAPFEPEAPSALDRIRMSQEQPAPTVDAAPARTNPMVVHAISRGADRLFKADRPAAVSVRVDCTAPVAALATAAPDPDSELGTLAIPVDTTRFDDRWARVRRAPAVRLMQAQLDRAAVTPGLGEATTLERVNLWVNRQIAYADDERNYRQRDFWATADETVARGSGDCEDYAILKMHMLRAAGIDGDRMKLVLLRDLAINADHAFLMVRSQAGWVVLDNMTDRIYDGRQANAVRPIMSFSGDRRWIHGYRDAAAPMVMAAVAAPKVSATAFASAARAANGRPSFKTALQPATGVKLALAHVSIGNALPRMFGRLASRGTK